MGRQTAQGLYNLCTPVSSPKPGDLVFFKGTYDTPGVSHCGIYVGDGGMLHCGDPIGYANINLLQSDLAGLYPEVPGFLEIGWSPAAAL